MQIAGIGLDAYQFVVPEGSGTINSKLSSLTDVCFSP